MLREKVFAKLNPIHDLSQAFRRYEHFAWIDASFALEELTLKQLAQTILDFEHPKTTAMTKYKKRYGSEIVVMIPSDSTPALMQEIYHNIIKQVHATNLLSLCFYNQKKNGHYLHIYIYEREFFPQGKETPILAKRTSYRNSVTKKLCSADNPNAELMYTKGDQIGSTFTYFSEKKVRILAGTGTDLSNILQVLKNLIAATVNSFGLSFPVGYFLTKFSFKDVKGSYLHRNTFLWNEAFKEVDEELDNLISAGKYCDIDTRKGVDDLCEKYQKIKDNEQCTFDNKYKVQINIGSEYSKVKSYVDLFLRKFRSDLKKVYQNYFGVIEETFV